jgi:hypothetical protein
MRGRNLVSDVSIGKRSSSNEGRMKIPPGCWRHRLLLMVLLGMFGCSVFVAKETLYLRSAQDRATQDEVKQQMGPPTKTKSGPNIEPVWVYQIFYEQPGNYLASPGTWCDEYVLTFDGQAVLRRWTHRSYFHGSELQPRYCVPGGVDGPQ